jgi:plasmid stabilization system protein ParE
MKIEWSPLSIKRANEIAEYIALDSLEESNKWRQDLINRVEQLKKFPKSGRVVPELNDILKRELIFGNYRIIYRISENKIFILTLRHIRQRLADDYISSK